jgi:ABC-type polysaccharide/polyol phosphate export permease
MIVVYTLAFTFILGIRSEMFVFYVMLGQLAWTFFASSISGHLAERLTHGLVCHRALR